MIRKTVIALLLAATGVSAQAALNVGDIAIIGRINNASTDTFAFVTLSNIAAGETIYFTDNGWTGSQFRGASASDGDGNENLTKWTASANVAAGSIIASNSSGFSYSSNIPGMTQKFGNLDFSQSGDQINAFQSTANNPLFNPTTKLYTFDDTNGFENASSSTTGGVPTGLVSGVTAISLNQMLAGGYSVKASVLGGAAKTKDQWLSTFATASNWQATAALPTASILVTAVPEPKSYAMLLAGLGLMGMIARRRSR